MGRLEITCPQCHQLNVRYTGWAALFNPRRPRYCTLCETELATGRRHALDMLLAVPRWVCVYLCHIVIGAVLPGIVAALVWPSILDQPLYVRVVPLLCGALAGLALAERSRRAGTLLSRPRRRKDRPRR